LDKDNTLILNVNCDKYAKKKGKEAMLWVKNILEGVKIVSEELFRVGFLPICYKKSVNKVLMGKKERICRQRTKSVMILLAGYRPRKT
jgi:hypothetical protein